ncbi:SDR family oxidoreductase [Pseudohaliea sp.]|uniref:SDR family oxidoreductase n=1 Tax=Pseudohaliea sp. TaxID=2740289 RepID=UPI0032EE81EB
MEFSDKVVLVTGTGQGIGRAIAERFSALGAKVFTVSRTASSGQQTVDLIRQAGGEAVFHQADLQHREYVEQSVKAAVAEYGALDVVVHNAAVFPFVGIEELSEEDLEQTLAVNLKAAFWFAQVSIPFLRQSEYGRLLFTSSVTGPRVSMPGLSHYAASKAGLNGFIRSAALEFAKFGVTVNGVEPGLIKTPAMANLGDESNTERMRANIPLKRLGEPGEIAAAMTYLATREAGFVTGQTIVVDGGALLPENPEALEW